MEPTGGAPPTGVMVGGPTGGVSKVGGGGLPVALGPVGGGGGEGLEERRARMRRQRMAANPDLGMAEGPVTPPPPSPLLAPPQEQFGTAPPPTSPNAGGVYPRLIDAFMGGRWRGGPGGIIGRLRERGVLPGGGGGGAYGGGAGPVAGALPPALSAAAGSFANSPWGRAMGPLAGAGGGVRRALGPFGGLF